MAGLIFEPCPCHFEKCVSFIDKQMILVPFFYTPNQKSVILKKKPIVLSTIRPASVQNRLFCTQAGLKWQNEIVFSQIRKKTVRFRAKV